jgi:hypothetical protein
MLLVPPHTWCWEGVYRTYHTDVAHYHGSGGVRVCSAFTSAGATHFSKTCGINSSASTANPAFRGIAEAANGSDYRHTIWGHAYR